MKEQINRIVALFSEAGRGDISAKETWDEFAYKANFQLSKIPDDQCLLRTIPEISDRDSWRLIITSNGGDSILDIKKSSGEMGDIKSDLEPYREDDVCLKFIVEKQRINKKLTVYDWFLFTDFLQGTSLSAFLNAVSNRLDDNLTVEVWTDGFNPFKSNTIAFISKGGTATIEVIAHRHSRVSARQKYCLSNFLNGNILPEDLLTDSTTDKVSLLFRKASMALSMLFVCDNSSMGSNLELGICGYKTFKSQYEAQQLDNLTFEDKYCNSWFEIYDWSYTGGYTSDRLCIARNIISLNVNGDDICSISVSTLRSIKSNFKIFEQDNVRQYIKVRNEISSLLINMQREVNSIVDGFASDFKKNILAVFTFFFTVVVVRVISKGDFLGGFTTPVFILSLIFLALSIALLIFSRMELEKKKCLFEKHYDQIKNRYKSLLSEEEIIEMFKDCNPNIQGSHANYIEWQSKVYTWLWIACVVVLALFVLFAWKYSLLSSLSNCPVIKLIMQCCIKNI